MNDRYDVVIVGGGPAGLSAALLLARARRRVLISDTGEPCNAPASASHGLLTRDGAAPRELLRLGRADLERYDTVQFRDEKVVGGKADAQGVELTFASGQVVKARKVILATGMVDDLPPIPGLAEMWGKSVFRCPYCHAWEFRDQPFAILASGKKAFELCFLLGSWTRDLVLCSGGPAQLDPNDRFLIERSGITIREQHISALEGTSGQLERIRFGDGSVLPRRAAVVCFPQRPTSDLPVRLGLVADGVMRLTPFGQTTNPHIYVAGDLGNQYPPQFLVSALYSGAFVGQHVNHTLAYEAFVATRPS